MMAKIERFEDLNCWKAARELSKIVYQSSIQGEISKDFGFRNQLRRAAVSTMNNIAEGFARNSDKEFIRFLDISQSSSAEVKSMIYLCQDLNYLNQQQILQLHQIVDQTRNLTLGLIRYLKNKNKTSQ